MRPFMYFVFLTGLLAPFTMYAQAPLKTYEFPEFGIKVPFFEGAKKELYNAGKPNEEEVYLYEYNHQYKTKQRIIGHIILKKGVGCVAADTFYNFMERHARMADNRANALRPLSNVITTMYLGWGMYDATLTMDNSPENIVRKVQGFYNGDQILILDVLFINEDFSGLGGKIFDDPGYSSILRPLPLPELQLRLRVRGHVRAYYDKPNKLYYVGRCDKLTTSYPQLVFEQLNGSPAAVALSDLAEHRNRVGFSNASLQTISGEGDYAKFPGGITKLTIKEPDSAGDVIKYYFSFNGRHYAVTAIVPYGPDDNRLFYKQDRQISAETTKEMDARAMELLKNLERL